MNDLVGSFILASGILISSDPAQDHDAENAIKALTKATYKYSTVDRQIKRLEKVYIPKNVQIYGGYTITLIRTVAERKISYEFTF